MKRFERKWMYEETVDKKRRPTTTFINGVKEFIEVAKQQKEYHLSENKLRCPCTKCKNLRYLQCIEVEEHLYTNGFCANYHDWICHGESYSQLPEQTPIQDNECTLRDMITDAFESSVVNNDNVSTHEEEPHPQAKAFFDMLNSSEKSLYEGSKMSLLEVASRIVTLKSEHNLSFNCVDGIASLIEDIIPENNVMTRSFYNTKKIVKGLQLPHQKIDACADGCMLFWKDDILLDKCKKCGKDRYKISEGNIVVKVRKSKKGSKRAEKSKKPIPLSQLIYFPLAPRLQRLYATKNIAEQMRWHKENPRTQGKMCHPSDGEEWKRFDLMFPDFADESRNVRLGLCTDGFAPFGQFGKSYSCWPVMITPYNLPPWLCLKKQFIFLSLIVPGPKNPKNNLDVYLQPLIEDLKVLWAVGVETYDVSTKQNFQLRASLMWTINDFPAYGMLSGWSTSAMSRSACPYCMEESQAFRLPNSNKMCWFDCHRSFLPDRHIFRKNKKAFKKGKEVLDDAPIQLSGFELWELISDFPSTVDGTNEEFKELKKKRNGWYKRSIFWELPYWKTMLIRHNLDVMHIEKNFFEQLIHTIMDVEGKTCDTIGARRDLKSFCDRRQLHIRKDGSKPKSLFSLDKAQRKVLCEWLKQLRFPDGYASDLSRCVDLKKLKLHGLKSHDCHVFMERLLPVALKKLVPTNVWNAITEISQFFRDLCSSSISTEDMIRLEEQIPEILCKLEMIFPPSFFNPMEHLPVHLPYEARVGGPVQYRWMYPFERYLNHLKRKIKNKARVEGSICNGYLTEEIANFCSLYFEKHIETKARNLNIEKADELDSSLPDFFQTHDEEGCSSIGGSRYLDDKEYNRAHLYVLSNCEILEPYEREFVNDFIAKHPNVSRDDVWVKHEEEFPPWFRNHVIELNIQDDFVRSLAIGPSRKVKTWSRYSINGFNFQTYDRGNNKARCNYGVAISSLNGDEYYGILEDVIELCYSGRERAYKTVLFKCEWMDNSSTGTRVHDRYKLVEVNYTRKYSKYDPFALAHQAYQVYFAPYPTTINDRNQKQWWAIFKTKARSQIDTTFFQEEVVSDGTILSPTDDIIYGNENINEEEEELEVEVDEIVRGEGEGEETEDVDENESDGDDDDTEDEEDDEDDDDDGDESDEEGANEYDDND